MSKISPRGNIISSAPRKNIPLGAGTAAQYLTYGDVIAKRKANDEAKRLKQDLKRAKAAQPKKAQIKPKKVKTSKAKEGPKCGGMDVAGGSKVTANSAGKDAEDEAVTSSMNLSGERAN